MLIMRGIRAVSPAPGIGTHRNPVTAIPVVERRVQKTRI